MEYNFYLCGRSIECSTKGADGQNSSIVDKAAIQRGVSLRKLLQNKYSLTIFIIADPAEIFDLVVSSPDPSNPGKFVPKKKVLVMEPFHGDDFIFFGMHPPYLATMHEWSKLKDGGEPLGYMGKGRRSQVPNGELPCIALRTTWRKRVSHSWHDGFLNY